jgi:glycosyltransferase involved in cell wall biosynthesis
MTIPPRPDLLPPETAATASDPPDPRTLRVAVFSDSLPERNGAGAYYLDLAAQLRPELGGMMLFQPAKRRRFLRLALPLPGDATQKLITPNVFRLWREYRAFRPHLVVAVTPGPFGLVGLALAKRHRTAFVTGFHTHFEELVRLYGDTLFYRVCHRYLIGVNRFLLARSDAVVVNNRGLIPVVESLGARQVEVMGTPLSRAFLDVPPVPPPTKLERVIFAGRLAPEKNLEAVVAAAVAHPGLHFVLAGDGPLRREMEQAAARLANLELTGWLERDALRAEIDRASLLLLPSHFETFGTVAFEAMARGRPALVSANAGILDWPLLRPALFAVGGDETLATALGRLLALPPEEWAEKAGAARAAAQQLNHETIVQWAAMVSRHATVRA